MHKNIERLTARTDAMGALVRYALRRIEDFSVTRDEPESATLLRAAIEQGTRLDDILHFLDSYEESRLDNLSVEEAYDRWCDQVLQDIEDRNDPSSFSLSIKAFIEEHRGRRGPIVRHDLSSFKRGEPYKRRGTMYVQATRTEAIAEQVVSMTCHLKKVPQGWQDAAGVIHT